MDIEQTPKNTDWMEWKELFQRIHDLDMIDGLKDINELLGEAVIRSLGNAYIVQCLQAGYGYIDPIMQGRLAIYLPNVNRTIHNIAQERDPNPYSILDGFIIGPAKVNGGIMGVRQSPSDRRDIVEWKEGKWQQRYADAVTIIAAPLLNQQELEKNLMVLPVLKEKPRYYHGSIMAIQILPDGNESCIIWEDGRWIPSQPFYENYLRSYFVPDNILEEFKDKYIIRVESVLIKTDISTKKSYISNVITWTFPFALIFYLIAIQVFIGHLTAWLERNWSIWPVISSPLALAIIFIPFAIIGIGIGIGSIMEWWNEAKSKKINVIKSQNALPEMDAIPEKLQNNSMTTKSHLENQKRSSPMTIKEAQDAGWEMARVLIEKPEDYDMAIAALREAREERKNGNETAKKGCIVEIIMGLPGAGKSSVVAREIKKRMEAIEIDIDLVKEGFPEYDGGIGTAAVHEESKLVVCELLKEAAKNFDNIIYHIVGSNLEKLNKLIDEFKESGYTVNLRLISVTPETAIALVKDQFYRTGKVTPPELILAYGNKHTEVFNSIIKSRNDITY